MPFIIMKKTAIVGTGVYPKGNRIEVSDAFLKAAPKDFEYDIVPAPWEVSRTPSLSTQQDQTPPTDPPKDNQPPSDPPQDKTPPANPPKGKQTKTKKNKQVTKTKTK